MYAHSTIIPTSKLHHNFLMTYLLYFCSTRETWSYWKESRKGPQKCLRDWIISQEEKLRQLGLFGLEKRRLRGILQMYISTWREAEKKTAPGSPQWFPVTGQEAEGTKWNRRLLLNIRKHFFITSVTKHWHKLPWEIVESPTLEIFKSWLDTVLDNQLQVALLKC